ncbi:MAG: MgtC/SapB family protein [Patescibacteria group bacterium]
MSQFLLENSGIILNLIIAVALGLVIGAERRFVHKEAGMKTHALVSLGAAVFVVVSEAMTAKYINVSGLNPAMIASQIVVGVGFLGAGSIVFQGNRLSGLTTASGFWVTAGIGMAAGFGLTGLATVITVLVLIVLLLVNFIEKPIVKISENNENAFK